MGQGGKFGELYMARSFRVLLVTGGAGFIGSNFIRYLFGPGGYKGTIVNFDALTYAGSRESLADVEERYGSIAGGVARAGSTQRSAPRYVFRQGDIRNRAALEDVFREFDIDGIVNFAAETHVDRSIRGPGDFVQANIVGCQTLLDVARERWASLPGRLFHQVSTDEVYGSLGQTGSFSEDSPYDPRSPYAASKAAADFLVRSYGHSYGLAATISNCGNNYGPFQHPEKFIPSMILKLLAHEPLPIYGDGLQVREWLHVEDHARAIWLIMRQGQAGRAYAVGAGNEWTNLALAHRLVELVAEESGGDLDRLRNLIESVADRPGHDRRYAIDSSRIRAELGWAPARHFDEGLRDTVRWYRDHRDWADGMGNKLTRA
jgi:dTDP-glucose 4,6-dehydratase